MLLVMALSMVSCGGNDEKAAADNEENNLPEGTVTVNLTNNEYVNTGTGGLIKWVSPNDMESYSHAIDIVSLGKKAGLGSIDINSIPENGWARKIACKPGYAYIIRYVVPIEQSYLTYSGVYVVKNLQNTAGGIMGAEIQYCKFTPGKGWNQ